MTDSWFDTHLHLLYHDRLHYDWTAGFPLLQQQVPIESYASIARGLGISAALYMEVDVRSDGIDREIDLVTALGRDAPDLLIGMVAACRPEDADEGAIAAFADHCHANPFLRGFRRILHTMPDDLSAQPHFRRNVARLCADGRPFDLIVRADQLDVAIALADALPDVPFVLNHFGNPFIDEEDQSFWSARIAALAERLNVACKISGIVVNGSWAALDAENISARLAPFFNHVVGCFGTGRIVWGSDFPVCNLTTGLPLWMAVTRRLIDGWGNDEIAALAHRNARRIYRVAETGK